MAAVAVRPLAAGTTLDCLSVAALAAGVALCRAVDQMAKRHMFLRDLDVFAAQVENIGVDPGQSMEIRQQTE